MWNPNNPNHVFDWNVGFGSKEVRVFTKDPGEVDAWVKQHGDWFFKELAGKTEEEQAALWAKNFGKTKAKTNMLKVAQDYKDAKKLARATKWAAKEARRDAAKAVDAAVGGGEDAAVEAGTEVGAEVAVAAPEVVADAVIVAGGDVAAGVGCAVFGGIALVAGPCILVGSIFGGIYQGLWDLGGFEWPFTTAWENKQTIDLTDGVGKKPWLMWYEEGTGRIMVHAYATQEDSHTDTVSWHVDRVLMKWDVATAQPKEIGRWGPGFAKTTIVCKATSAMFEQYKEITKTGIAKRGLAGTSQSVDHLTDFCRRFKAWKAKLREKAESAATAVAEANIAANLALLASERAANVARAEGNIASAEAAKKAKEALDAANVALAEANIASAEAAKKAFL